MRWLAYAHPLAMLLILGLGIQVLRDGLRIRRARLLGNPTDSRRHRRLARWFVGLLVPGFAGGLSSMLWLRPEPAMESFHFALVLAAVACWLTAGALGLRLERGRPVNRDAHAALGAAGLLLGLAAAVAGFAILP